MKFAFDFHGVINIHTEFFKEIMQSLVNNGKIENTLFPLFNSNIENNGKHEVWIISGKPINETEEELKEIGIKKNIHYQKIDTITSWLLRNMSFHKIKVWRDNNGWWIDDEELWNSIKAKICEENNIDFLIDNSIEYKKYFDNIKTEFIYFGNYK